MACVRTLPRALAPAGGDGKPRQLAAARNPGHGPRIDLQQGGDVLGRLQPLDGLCDCPHV